MHSSHVVQAVARVTAAISLLLLHVRHHGTGVAGLNIQQEAGYAQNSQRLTDSLFIKLKHSKEDSDLERILSINLKYSKADSNTIIESAFYQPFVRHAIVQWHVALMLIKALDTLWLRLLLTSYRLARVH
jgi:hypothetical protein